MDEKRLYFKAVRHFRERNRSVLPQVQLQTGANERWFARELCVAMNTALTGRWSPSSFDAYADAEVGWVDIAVYEPERRRPTLIYEVKIIYSTQAAGAGIVKRANNQLRKSRLSADKKLGIFFLVYCSRREATREEHEKEARSFRDKRTRLIRKKFHSDHGVRATELSPLRRVDYSATAEATWWTQSWVVRGAVGPTR